MNGKALELDTPADSGLRERARASFALRFGAREIKLKSRITTAGRSSAADIPLVGALVSRRHATFSLTDNGVEVSDHGSRNGVFVNGERISGPQHLRSVHRLQMEPARFGTRRGAAAAWPAHGSNAGCAWFE